ncbi:hypothetical protein J4464_04850 [Candidatus Woesearchaeota archaeon]|nr:hypothetical protein [Candidatus Woesearchaeota archaeon]
MRYLDKMLLFPMLVLAVPKAHSDLTVTVTLASPEDYASNAQNLRQTLLANENVSGELTINIPPAIYDTGNSNPLDLVANLRASHPDWSTVFNGMVDPTPASGESGTDIPDPIADEPNLVTFRNVPQFTINTTLANIYFAPRYANTELISLVGRNNPKFRNVVLNGGYQNMQIGVLLPSATTVTSAEFENVWINDFTEGIQIENGGTTWTNTYFVNCDTGITSQSGLTGGINFGPSPTNNLVFYDCGEALQIRDGAQPGVLGFVLRYGHFYRNGILQDTVQEIEQLIDDQRAGMASVGRNSLNADIHIDEFHTTQHPQFLTTAVRGWDAYTQNTQGLFTPTPRQIATLELLIPERMRMSMPADPRGYERGQGGLLIPQGSEYERSNLDETLHISTADLERWARQN